MNQQGARDLRGESEESSGEHVCVMEGSFSSWHASHSKLPDLHSVPGCTSWKSGADHLTLHAPGFRVPVTLVKEMGTSGSGEGSVKCKGLWKGLAQCSVPGV